MKGTFPVGAFRSLSTPFYYYDIALLKDTLSLIKTEISKYGYNQ
ncbi:MAG: diaminopimelate decarboxylase, partial [Tannerella sp.]|nr:diaminopimelate decarboxylase [Tannerella sp.]